MKMNYVALAFAALCLLALPFVGTFQTVEAAADYGGGEGQYGGGTESALTRLMGGDVGAFGDILSDMLPVLPELFQWVVGVVAVILEGILALVEVVVSFFLSPIGIPLLVQLSVQAVFGALGYGILGTLVGFVVGLPFCLVGTVCTTPLGALVGAFLGGLMGIFGQGEVPAGMNPDMDEIRGWADLNPLEILG